MKRIATSTRKGETPTDPICSPAAQTVESWKIPNTIIAVSKAALRPHRSASHPPTKAPKNRPMGLAVSTVPSCSGWSPNSVLSLGAASPIDCRSMPSITAVQKHRIKVAAAPERTPPPAAVVAEAMSPPQADSISDPQCTAGTACKAPGAPAARRKV